MRGLFTICEEEAFQPHILQKSFAEVGLWPWNPDRIRELCQKHCPAPYELNETPALRKLEKILSDIIAEQEAERDRIMSIGRLVRSDSVENSPRYDLRRRMRSTSRAREDISRSSTTMSEYTSSEVPPPKKRSRRDSSTQ